MLADKTPANPFGPQPVVEFDPAKEQHAGVVLGIALASVRDHEGNDRFLLIPGDDVRITVPTAGDHVKAQDWRFTVVDFYESKMSEYDSSFVFVPIKQLQAMRGIGTNVSAIQIKLQAGADANMVRDLLRSNSPQSCTASIPGATSKAPCWPPCKWSVPCSTFCCL